MPSFFAWLSLSLCFVRVISCVVVSTSTSCVRPSYSAPHELPYAFWLCLDRCCCCCCFLLHAMVFTFWSPPPPTDTLANRVGFPCQLSPQAAALIGWRLCHGDLWERQTYKSNKKKSHLSTYFILISEDTKQNSVWLQIKSGLMALQGSILSFPHLY